MVLRRLRNIFGGAAPPTQEPSPLYGLAEEERERIGTAEDPLHNFETAMQRNEEAERAVHNGDTERAIHLYEMSIAEEFVGSHPYERLATIYERRHNPAEALRVCLAFTTLAASGKMPRGAQRSANSKLPEFQSRIERYSRLLDESQ